MSRYPTCTDCGRTASEWIRVGDTRWEPDLKEIRPGTWKCWKCRGEPHPDMHVRSVKQKAKS